jgi:lysophospholipase L1-like esterase
MRSPRVFAIGATALTTAFAAALVGITIPANAATAVHYVALGDSYSSGVGAGSTSGSCGQSPNAYPALWEKANSPASFTFAACSGATTGDVISSQLSSLNSSTTLVSITIGGNDVGFTSIMETCVLGSTSSCESAVSAAESYANNTLPGQLSTVLSDIHAHAPNAKVIVLDYPVFYDTSVSVCVGLSSADHTAIDAGINDLDGVIKSAAAGNNATFADVRSQFSGHELCDGSGWLHSLNILDISESYHPTATGQSSGYLPVLSTAAASVGQ